MPLESKATQTTATNNATYLVNKRRRVFGAEISAPPRGSSPAAARPREAKLRLMKPPSLIPATLSGPGGVVSGDGWVRSTSLDHSVSTGEQSGRQLETERLRCPQIDHKL